MGLQDRAMRVALHIGMFGTAAQDKNATEAAQQRFNASTDSGRYTKKIIPKIWIKPIQRVATAARAYHKDITVPWGNNSAERLLASEKFDEYRRTMLDFETKWNKVVDEMIVNWPRIVQEAQQDLGGMFDPNDYPSGSEVRSAFTFQIDILPIENVNDFRIKLAEPEIARLKSDFAATLKKREDEIQQDLYQRLYQVTKRMADTLTKKQNDGKWAVFRDSLVNNIIDLTDMLPSLNVTNNMQLADLAATMRRELCTLLPEELRQDEADRLMIAEKAKEIADKMACMFSSNPANP